MKTILVTGGAGFIGSHFVDICLSESDYKVVIVDNLTYAGKLVNISHILNNPRVSFIEADISDTLTMMEIVDKNIFDYVINFAAESHVDRSLEDASIFIKSNVMGVQNLISLFFRRWSDEPNWQNYYRFIQISTDEVYGSLKHEGQFFENTPISPNNPYSASKASADLLCISYFKTFGFPVIITRSSNNYGPRQDYEKLIPKIITNLLNNFPIPLYGNGKNIRDWIYVEDNCRAIFKVLHSGKTGEVYNVGGNNEISNLDLANMIQNQLCLDNSLIEFVRDRPGHDFRYSINDNKISELIGDYRRVNFIEGVDKTIEFYKQNNRK